MTVGHGRAENVNDRPSAPMTAGHSRAKNVNDRPSAPITVGHGGAENINDHWSQRIWFVKTSDNQFTCCSVMSSLSLHSSSWHVKSTSFSLAAITTLLSVCWEAQSVLVDGSRHFWIYATNYLLLHIQGVSRKEAPKLFAIFSLQLMSFCVKFCKFVGNSYPDLSTNICRFMLLFHQMALIFPRVLAAHCVFIFRVNTQNLSGCSWKK